MIITRTKIKLLLLFVTFGNIIYSQTNNWEVDTLRNVVTVGIKVSPPFIIKNPTGDYSGVSIDLWKIIAQKLNVNYKFKVYEQDEISKMLSDVETSKIDISINPLTVTGKRIEKFDFTQPFYTSNLAIAVPVKNSNSISDFLKRFFTLKNTLIILIMGFALFIVGMGIWLIEKKNNSKEFRKGIKGIGDGVWWAATILATIGPATKSPHSFWGRVIGVLWMFTAIITISLLIGSTASYLTAGKMKSDINSLHSLKRKKVGTMKGTSCEAFLIKNFIPVEKNDYKTLSAGLESVKNSKIQAFVYDEPILRYLIFTGQMNDKVYIAPFKLSTNYYSFALPKKSGLTDKINTLIIQELEKITWKAILNKYNLN